MKVYISSSHKQDDDRQRTEELCTAVRDAGLADFWFARDTLRFKNKIHDPKELWSKVKDEIGACDALLIDVSGHPTSGRLVEMGIAYAQSKPVIIVEKQGAHHKELFYGVSSEIIKYNDFKDLSGKLKHYDEDRNFTVTDRWTVLLIFLLVGVVLGWFASRLFLPLGFIAAVVYWMAVRYFVASLRVYDRVVIYIPLALIWLAGFYLLQPMYLPMALAWLVGFWIITVPLLQKLKLAL